MNTMQWQTLAARAAEGTLSVEEGVQLLALCRESEEARVALMRVLTVERLLPLALSDPSGQYAAREVAMRLQQPDTASIQAAWRSAEKARRWLWQKHLRWVAAAAAIVLMLTGGAWWLDQIHTPAATLSRSEGIVWTGAAPSLKSSDLAKDTRLRAQAGLVELAFESGARMVLEGPFDVELKDGMHAYLHSGRISVRCPPSAHGFSVETTEGIAVDRGTEFCVHMVQGAAMEVHVLSGVVDVTAKNSGPTTTLFDNEGLRIHGPSIERIDADANTFVTSMPVSAGRAPGYIHWSFDEINAGTVVNNGKDLGVDGQARLDLLSYPDKVPTPGKGPQLIEGVSGKGLSLDGKAVYAESPFPGIGGTASRTVALWVRIPKELNKDSVYGHGIISWGSLTGPNAWQMSANTIVQDGPVGRLRLGIYDNGRIVGTTDLRDNQWHHIAVVMYGGSRASIATNVMLYVDGKPEIVTRKTRTEINTDVLNAGHGLWLGRNVAFPDPVRNGDPGPRFFKGDVDEVFIFNAALSHEEINTLMRTHHAPQ
ncbi:concanavalin A-like lectin/glucanase superfamily protein [Roseimicrobium gellanilyticum]|uniref:Concanavalin A-like lectin/glucanase superfamily protein n=1 Tax=Roseimicrobium gellanilyticum TaxID=748857 RepID=A0A366HA37_9BACT|nr:LamG-like jellyroll fold domain-containing protein [Roseimicrobium gellanilyticum]RBP39130.1 concanavalin A-like lectin/glucanase superfamily protein [Roseimicrobium gellanilyticum]